MTNRLHSKTKKSSDASSFLNAGLQTDVSNLRPFMMQAKTANNTQQPDLTTSLKRAEKHGHNPNQIQSADTQSARPIQSKIGIEPSQVIQAAFKFPWRKKTPKTFYRLDGRKPQDISNSGFQPHKPDGRIAIEDHVSGVLKKPDSNGGTLAKPHSQFVSTGKLGMLKDDKSMMLVPGKNLYKIKPNAKEQPNYQSVKEHYKNIGQKQPYPEQKEWVNQGGISPGQIKQYLPEDQLLPQLPLKRNPLMPWRRKSLKGWHNMPTT